MKVQWEVESHGKRESRGTERGEGKQEEERRKGWTEGFT